MPSKPSFPSMLSWSPKLSTSSSVGGDGRSRSRGSSYHASPPAYRIPVAHAVPCHQLGGPKTRTTNSPPVPDFPPARLYKKGSNNTENSGTSTVSGTSSITPSLDESGPTFSFGLDNQAQKPHPFSDETMNPSTPHSTRRSEPAYVRPSASPSCHGRCHG